MEIENLNKSLCEEMYGVEINVMEDSEVEKSQASQYKDCLLEMAAKNGKIIKNMTLILEKMVVFSRSKENMFHAFRKGITNVLEELRWLRCSINSRNTFLESLEYFLGMNFVKDKGKEAELRRVKRRANLVSKGSQNTPELRWNERKKRSGWRLQSRRTSGNQKLNRRLG